MKFKMDSTKVLSITLTVIGIAGTLLSNVVDSRNRENMKSEITEEIMEKLLKNKKD